MRTRFRVPAQALTLAAFVFALAAAPSGAVIVYQCGYNLCRVNGDGSSQATLTSDGSAANPYVGPSLSSDGSKLSFAEDAQLYVSEADAQNRVGPLENFGLVVGSTRLSPNGAEVAAEGLGAGDSGLVACFTAATAAGASGGRCAPGATDSAFSIGWAPGEAGLLMSVYADDEPGAPAGTTPEQICLASALPYFPNCTRQVAVYDGYGLIDPAISPNGSELAVAAAPQGSGQAASPQGAIWIFNYATGALIRQLTSGSADSEPAWSPDGSEIAFTRAGALFVTPSTGSPGSEKMIAAAGQAPTWGGAETPPAGASTISGSATPGGGAAAITALTAAHTKVKPGKAIIFDVTLSAATRFTLKVLGYVPASRHGRRTVRARYVLEETITVNGKQGLNVVSLARIHHHRLAVGRYEAQFTLSGSSRELKFTVAR